jgi:hypothetical protein
MTKIMTDRKELDALVELALLAAEGASDARLARHKIMRAALLAIDLPGLLADARRYRWLRMNNWNADTLCVVSYPKDAVKVGHDCPSMERLDEAIDAAMQAEAK